MAAEKIPPSDEGKVLREQLDWLIRRVECGRANNRELKRFAFVKYQLLKPFEKPSPK